MSIYLAAILLLLHKITLVAALSVDDSIPESNAVVLVNATTLEEMRQEFNSLSRESVLLLYGDDVSTSPNLTNTEVMYATEFGVYYVCSDRNGYHVWSKRKWVCTGAHDFGRYPVAYSQYTLSEVLDLEDYEGNDELQPEIEGPMLSDKISMARGITAERGVADI